VGRPSFGRPAGRSEALPLNDSTDEGDSLRSSASPHGVHERPSRNDARGPLYFYFYGQRLVLLFGHFLFAIPFAAWLRQTFARQSTWWSCSFATRVGYCSLRYTTPPFITKFTFSITDTSARGSPGTATISANFPASIVPSESCIPNNSAAVAVAD